MYTLILSLFILVYMINFSNNYVFLYPVLLSVASYTKLNRAIFKNKAFPQLGYVEHNISAILSRLYGKIFLLF